MTTHLKWAWTYGCPTVEECDSLEDAVGAARGAADAGTESFNCIEEVGVGVVDADRVGEVWKRLDAEEDAHWAESPKATHVIELRGPNRGADGWPWARIASVYGGNPDAALSDARARFGPARVRVRVIK